MYELSRIRLHSVGPKGARYQDVVLDLSGVGDPVTRPDPGVLFGVPSSGLAGRRPSQASVFFAENGNGKTVLIKLIFSVMLPGRRQTVGTTSSRGFSDFVLAGDVAHVALEWQHTVTGARVVAGKVAAWRGHVTSSDPARLSEAWYSFRPGQDLTLDTLPVSKDGRLVEMGAFRDRLTEASKADPSLEVVWEQGHGAWTDRLDSLGLDSELFAYQRRMNAGEGEAADAFSFRSDEAFVDWLLTAVTKPDGPRSLADVVDGYARTLAQRRTLIAERDFVEGALQQMDPLAAAAEEADQAAALARQTGWEAEQFTWQVRTRHEREEARLRVLEEQRGILDEAERQADQQQRRLNRITLQLQREVAGLRLRDKQTEQGEIRTQIDTAKDHLSAWQATTPLLVHRAAEQKAATLRSSFGEAEQAAAPALAARDESASHLLRALDAVAAAADHAATAGDLEAAGLAEQASARRSEAIDQNRAAAAATSQATVWSDRIIEAQAALTAAVTDGLLPSDQDPATALTDAGETLNAAVGEAARTETERERVRGDLGRAVDVRRARDRYASTAMREAEDSANRHEQAVAVTAALASHERLAEILGVETVDLETDLEAALEALDVAVTDGEQQQTRLRMEETSDRAVLEALGTGGLLPPGADVSAAKDALEQEGIPAYSGWEYLAQMPDEEREQAWLAFPHLVDGVVLNNPGHLDRAREVLAEARLLPRRIVAVGTTRSLQDSSGAGPAPGAAVVIDPNPAMYDEDKADEVRQDLLAAQADRQVTLDAIAKRLRGDRALNHRIIQWSETYPPGTLADMEQTAGRAAQQAEQAAEQAQQAGEQVRDLQVQEQALAARLPELRDAVTDARERVQALDALVSTQGQVPAWQDRVRDLKAKAEAAEREAGELAQAAEGMSRSAAEKTRHADDQRRVARQARADMGEVHGGHLDVDTPVPSKDVPTLKVAYREAIAAYAKVEVGADLRADLQQAETIEGQARAAVQEVPEPVRAAAAALLSSPDGADEAGRAAATQRAQRALDDLTEQDRQIGEQVGRLKAEFERLQPQEVNLDPYGKPGTVEDGGRLLTMARTDWQAAQDRYEQAKKAAEEADHEIDSTRALTQGFAAVAEALRDQWAEQVFDGHEAFEGSLPAAQARQRALREDLRASQRLREETADALRKAAGKLNQYATNERFDTIESQVHKQIRATAVDDLSRYAREWAQALRPRLRTLTDDLEQIERHRTQIVARLRGLVEVALKTLRSAERVSELPTTLGDWGGQKFLHIRFGDPDPAVLDDRLGQVIDEAAGAGVRGEKAGGKRDGMTLLLKGVRAVLPRGVKVEMLKPDASLRTERVRVADVAQVFSGGQLLTAAIILYCTMAALRANDRGLTGRRHAGVLFLDNPIGRASAGYLLDLQLGVAHALGVQLVYTTGLFDANALSVFPLIVRLRNDKDLRTGMKYLTVDEDIRAVLDPLPGPDGSGSVLAARLFRRPATPQPEPESQPETAGAP